MRYTSVFLFLSALTLSACGLVEVEYDEQPADTPPAAEQEPVRETKNVTYTGVVQPAGISIYQQGSHRLVLPGGKFILLESDDLDLNGYVEEEVKIFGALRPTVEAGGMIMRVEKIELIVTEDDSKEEKNEEEEEEIDEEREESSSSSEDTDPEESSSSEAEAEAEEASSSEESEASEESSAMTSEITEEEEEEEETEEVSVVESDPAFIERVSVMARQDYTAANWTQQYCTSHISFCAPVHKNWWFKSYGATNSTLWHVEFNSEPIEALYQGPIALDLLPGSIGEQSGTVETVDGQAVGYFEWTFGRHFRVSGDASLIEAITHITQNITEYTQ